MKWTPLLIAFALTAVWALPNPPSAQALDYDCSDFANQAEAQDSLLATDNPILLIVEHAPPRLRIHCYGFRIRPRKMMRELELIDG
jgi:hypothetical protein